MNFPAKSIDSIRELGRFSTKWLPKPNISHQAFPGKTRPIDPSHHLILSKQKINQTKMMKYSWWFRYPAKQLRLVNILLFTRLSYIPGGAGFLPSSTV